MTLLSEQTQLQCHKQQVLPKAAVREPSVGANDNVIVMSLEAWVTMPCA